MNPIVKQNKELFVNVKVTRLFTRRSLGVVFAVRDEATKVLEQSFVNFGLFRPIATSYQACGYKFGSAAINRGDQTARPPSGHEQRC